MLGNSCHEPSSQKEFFKVVAEEETVQAKRHPRGQHRRYDAIVSDVPKKGEPVSPDAVCAAVQEPYFQPSFQDIVDLGAREAIRQADQRFIAVVDAGMDALFDRALGTKKTSLSPPELSNQ